MKITSQGITPVQLRKSAEESSQTMGKASDKTTASAKETAQLSSLSLSATDTFEQLSSQDEVDMNKVLAMRSAIAKGELSLDEDVLINAIMDMHRL